MCVWVCCVVCLWCVLCVWCVCLLPCADALQCNQRSAQQGPEANTHKHTHQHRAHREWTTVAVCGAPCRPPGGKVTGFILWGVWELSSQKFISGGREWMRTCILIVVLHGFFKSLIYVQAGVPWRLLDPHWLICMFSHDWLSYIFFYLLASYPS